MFVDCDPHGLTNLFLLRCMIPHILFHDLSPMGWWVIAPTNR
jgi:hypothetical protein